MLDEIYEAVAMNLLPPNEVTHFHATDEFVQWFAKYADGRFVIEVGAGQCEFTKLLRDSGVCVVAIEPRAPDEVIRENPTLVVPMTAQRCGGLLKRPALVFAARPDHSGWFTMLPDLIHPESELLYIGLESNVEKDLDLLGLEHDLIHQGAGEDNEVVLRVKT